MNIIEPLRSELLINGVFYGTSSMVLFQFDTLQWKRIPAHGSDGKCPVFGILNMKINQFNPPEDLVSHHNTSSVHTFECQFQH